jgi:hypothetical protein
MGSSPSRRHFVGGLAAGALVTGFDPIGRGWVTGRAAGVPAPALKGRLLYGEAAPEALLGPPAPPLAAGFGDHPGAWSIAWAVTKRYLGVMGAQPSQHDGHDGIHLGGKAAVVVPMDEYRLLKALKERASAEEIEEAEIDAAIAEHEAWKAAGRPDGTISHEVVMAELFGPLP